MEVPFLPTKWDLAAIWVVAHARMQFKKLPHAFAVNTAPGNPSLAIREMTNQGLKSFASRKVAGNLASFKHFVTRSNCPAPVPAYVKESLHRFIQLQVHFSLFYFPQPLLFSLKRSETQIPLCEIEPRKRLQLVPDNVTLNHILKIITLDMNIDLRKRK